jgi:hypothetical protein
MRLIKGPDAGKTGRIVTVARHRMIIDLDGELVSVAVSPGWIQLTDPAEITRFTNPGPDDTGVRDLLTAWLLTPTNTFTRGGPEPG